MNPCLAIIIPCYNEEAVLAASLKELLCLLDALVAENAIKPDSYILCVDDGSTDSTLRIIREANAADSRVRAISLAHNVGHQHALLAGVDAVVGHCDAAVTIDADLQDDPAAIRSMLRHMADGAEVVYGVRSSRDVDSTFKRLSAKTFYKLQQAMGIESVYNHADFRLMSERALRCLQQYREANVYLRGIVPQIGLQSASVSYPRAARAAGETKYTLSKMLALSIDGITSFSAKPMRWIFMLGLLLLVADILVALWVLIAYLRHDVIWGWSSLMLSVWFLGSLILISLGIVGEYIGKIYTEVKHRPHYFIRETID